MDTKEQFEQSAVLPVEVIAKTVLGRNVDDSDEAGQVGHDQDTIRLIVVPGAGIAV